MSYVHPEVLVSTDWVLEHHQDPNIRIVEVSEDFLLYEQGHIPGSVKIDWHTNLQREDIRDFIDAAAFEKLVGDFGISNDTTVVFYGDKNNWWAAYAFWFFKYNGHQKAVLMNGGRAKWVAEGKPMQKEAPSYAPAKYNRSADEYSGKLTHMADYPQEGALRAGHIPGAISQPWAQTVNPDGTFKSHEELSAMYGNKGVTGDKDVIAYCRIAERSSHTWFILKYLLGYEKVRNYDGSWTEWGNVVGVPIEKSV
jgi:thiosulfate/3-mercaptopyruvate sulfurtransferase